MSKDENYERITITIPPELGRWVRRKKEILDSQDRRLRTSTSAIIADAISEMKEREERNEINLRNFMMHEDQGKSETQPHSGENPETLHDPSVGGSSTRKETRYQPKRRGNSSK
jgi:menaquinone-dependent protoporphyrinogen IX oxidase